MSKSASFYRLICAIETLLVVMHLSPIGKTNLFVAVYSILNFIITVVLIISVAPILILIFMAWVGDAEDMAGRTKYRDYVPGTNARRSFFEHANDFEELRQIVLLEPSVDSWRRDGRFGPYHRELGEWKFTKIVDYSTETSKGFRSVDEVVSEGEVFDNLKITPQQYTRLIQLMQVHHISSVEKTWVLVDDLRVGGNKGWAREPYGPLPTGSSVNDACVCFEMDDPSCRYFHRLEDERPTAIFIDYLPHGDSGYIRNRSISTFEKLEGSWYLEQHYAFKRPGRDRIKL